MPVPSYEARVSAEEMAAYIDGRMELALLKVELMRLRHNLGIVEYWKHYEHNLLYGTGGPQPLGILHYRKPAFRKAKRPWR